MIHVEIGNDQAIEGYRSPDDDVVRFRPYTPATSTVWEFPDSFSLQDCLLAISGSMRFHYAEGATMPWIESTSGPLRELLIEHLNLPKTIGGKPGGWEDPEHPVATEEGPTPKSVAKKARKATKKVASTSTEFMLMHLALLWAFVLVMATRLQVRTTSGRDWQARLMGDSASNGSGLYASGSYMGVSADTGAPNAANTVLPGEVASGTLARKQVAYSHTIGTSSYALTGVFVFDQDITLAKLGIFNAASGGTLVFESLLNAVVVGKPGDQSTLTETVTI